MRAKKSVDMSDDELKAQTSDNKGVEKDSPKDPTPPKSTDVGDRDPELVDEDQPTGNTNEGQDAKTTTGEKDEDDKKIENDKNKGGENQDDDGKSGKKKDKSKDNSNKNEIKDSVVTIIHQARDVSLNGMEDQNNLSFSSHDYRTISEERLTNLLELESYLVEESLLNEGVKVLRKFQICILVNENRRLAYEYGLLLGTKLQALNQHRNIHVVDRLQPAKIIDFEKDIFQNDELENSLVIFHAGTHWANDSINEFLLKINSCERLDNFIPSYFSNTTTYIIFTSTQENLKELSKLDQLGASLKLRNPQKDTLERYTTSKLQELEKAQAWKEEQRRQFTLLTQDERWTQQVISQLNLASEIQDLFARTAKKLREDAEWLPTIQNISPFIQSIKNFKGWFLGELARDREAWNLVFALGLLHASPDKEFDRISVIEFEAFHTALVSYFKEVEGIKKEEDNWSGIYSEISLFQKCRIEKNIDPISHRHFVQFQDISYVDEIWHVFFNDLSLKLAQLIPFLQDQMSNNHTGILAARILGRIGALDPQRTLNWLSQWFKLPERAIGLQIGYVFQGVMASGNDYYTSICKSFLRACHQGKLEEVIKVIIVYNRIGVYDITYAMPELCNIARDNLSAFYEKMVKLRGKKEWRRHQLFETGFTLNDLEDLIDTEVQIEVLNKDWENFWSIFYLIQQSILNWCSLLDISRVFQEWNKWLTKESKPLKVFVIQMLLSKDGILHELDREIKIYDIESETFEDWHHFIRLLHKSPDIVLTVDFFSHVFESLEAISPKERLQARDQLLNYFESWIKSSLGYAKAEKTLSDFCIKLIIKHDRLGKLILQKIESFKSNRKELEKDYEEFKASLLSQLEKAKVERSQALDQEFRDLFG